MPSLLSHLPVSPSPFCVSRHRATSHICTGVSPCPCGFPASHCSLILFAGPFLPYFHFVFSLLQQESANYGVMIDAIESVVRYVIIL